jgi:hypothetical protein
MMACQFFDTYGRLVLAAAIGANVALLVANVVKLRRLRRMLAVARWRDVFFPAPPRGTTIDRRAEP